MRISSLKNLLFVFCLFALPLSVTNCTSSDEEISVLEEELEGIEEDGSDELTDEDDVEEIADEDLVDEVDDEDDLDDDFDEDDSEEVAEDDSGEDELEDELDEDDDEEFAENDDEDDDFDEFDDEDNAEEKKEFAQNEESLEEELKQKPLEQDYPVVENAQPAFPEEVIGQNQGVSPAPVPLATDQTITSETQEIAIVEPSTAALPQDDLGAADPIVPIDDDSNVPVQSWVPVVKIKADPFFRNQRLMNAVYIARPKDSIESISQKIYGSDRSQELKSDNPHLAKGVDPGDKVYYNSPNRPEDKSLLKVYYADVGLQPQTYQTKSGDNMRRLGSKLLGFPDGWKEVWAINPSIDSKTILPSGLDVTYWTGEEQSAEVIMAKTEEIDEPEAPATGTVEDFSEAELPPEPPLPESQIAMPENSLEPEIVPDIEPFPEQGIEQVPTPVVTAPQNNSLLSVGALALLLIAGVGLVAIQIKKRKDNTGMRPQSLEYTQV